MTRWRPATCAGMWLAWALSVSAQAAPPQAVSADGRWRAAAEGTTIVIDDTTGVERRRTLRVAALDGSRASEVAEIHDAAPRRSFVIALRTLPELWELSYDPRAEPVYDGLVHDYRMSEGVAVPGFLNPRRTKLQTPLRGLWFDRSRAYVLGRAGDSADRRAVLQVWQLDVRRRIGEVVAQGDPDTAAAKRVERDGREWAEVPDRAGGPAIMIDMHRP